MARPFRPEHLKAFSPGKRDIMGNPEDAEAVSGVSLYLGGKMVAAIGAAPFRDGLLIWLIADDALRARPVIFHRSFLEWLHMLESVTGASRVYCAVDPNWQASIDWAERLGFEFSGGHVMPNGRELWIMVRNVRR